METVQRTVARVETKTHLGPSAQVDDENLSKLTATPHYQDLLAAQRPVIERDGVLADLIAGQAARS